MITQFQTGVAIGISVGLLMSWFFLFIGSIIEDKYRIREKKITENVKNWLSQKKKEKKK